MSSFMQRELGCLSEALSTRTAAERSEPSVQVLVFLQVLEAGVQSIAHVTLKALDAEVGDLYVAF